MGSVMGRSTESSGDLSQPRQINKPSKKISGGLTRMNWSGNYKILTASKHFFCKKCNITAAIISMNFLPFYEGGGTHLGVKKQVVSE